MCNICIDGYAKNVLGNCDTCEGDGFSIPTDSLIFLIGFLVVVSATVYYLCVRKKQEREKSDRLHEFRKRTISESHSNQESSLRDTLIAAQNDRDHWFNRGRTKAKIMVSFFQIMASFEGILEVRFPPVFEKFTRWISSTVNLDALQLARAGCIMNTNFYSTLLAQTILPIALSLIIFISFLICKLLWGKTKEKRAQYRDFASSSFLTITYIVFASVSTTIFDTFNCQKVGDDPTLYLARDQSIDCDSSQHKSYKIYAAAMILIYPVGIPLVYFVCLWMHRVEIQRPNR